MTGSRLSRHDVVITSYETAASDWCDPKPRAKKGAKGKEKALLPGAVEEEEVETAGGEEDLKESGALFSAELYRGKYLFEKLSNWTDGCEQSCKRTICHGTVGLWN